MYKYRLTARMMEPSVTLIGNGRQGYKSDIAESTTTRKPCICYSIQPVSSAGGIVIS